MSLLTFLLAMGIWVRSYFLHETIAWWSTEWDSNGGVAAYVFHQIDSSDGDLGLFRNARNPQAPVHFFYGLSYTPDNEGARVARMSSNGRTRVSLLGFLIKDSGATGWNRAVYIVLPLWAFELFAIPPLLWLVRWRGQRGRGFPVEVKSVC